MKLTGAWGEPKNDSKGEDDGLKIKQATFHTTDRYFAAVTMETITVERWMHMSRRFLITMRRTHRIYGVLRFHAVIITSARIWLTSVKEFREIGEPIMRGILGRFCFVTTSFSYVKVFKLIRHHQWQVQASQSSQNPDQHAINLEKYKKSVYTIFFIVLIFFYHASFQIFWVCQSCFFCVFSRFIYTLLLVIVF